MSSVATECGVFGTSGCFLSGETRILRGVTLSGVEALKFIPFVTIKRRVQIGVTVGGGVGTLDGTLETHNFFAEPIPPFNRPNYRQAEVVTTEDAKELFPLSVVPLAKVEIAGRRARGAGAQNPRLGRPRFPGSEFLQADGGLSVLIEVRRSAPRRRPPGIVVVSDRLHPVGRGVDVDGQVGAARGRRWRRASVSRPAE